nr:uncharacterized mitochondrial protein AtMg00820-like [Tanacetum cinerariifolium]
MLRLELHTASALAVGKLILGFLPIYTSCFLVGGSLILSQYSSKHSNLEDGRINHRSWVMGNDSLRTGAPQGEGAQAIGVALGIKLIWNSTWRTGGRPGRSSGKASGNSLNTEPVVLTDIPSSITIDQVAPSTCTSQTNQETPSPVIPLSVEEAIHDIKVAYMDNNPYVDFIIPKPSSKESSSQSYKEALTESYWIEAIQEELNEFERLKVWELIPSLNRVMITLKWIYKVKLDELGGVLNNKALLVARGCR